MNLPNLITTSRLIVTVGVIVCLETSGASQRPTPVLVWAAFGMFMYAALSDFVDGWVARRYGLETMLGRVIDPFADKFLICGTWISLLRFAPHTENLEACLQTWMIVLIVAREFLVTTLRGVAEASGRKFPADRLGKLKMVAQCTALAAQLTMVAGTQVFEWFGFWFMWITLVLTVVSGAGYVVKARPVLVGK
ncbi:MAG: CDP-diacylglycerol--glycerol-3-phosphate 3-phosphatidyltransferase [Planctomycetes bacterium]|nr:CDP-diacylglycerol--glycerol-3-phosphate 3-phosphatidyltransferase [Planctomycetota bacterium]